MITPICINYNHYLKYLKYYSLINMVTVLCNISKHSRIGNYFIKIMKINVIFNTCLM